MNWQEIRQKYPHRWVVVEAFNAYTENGQRVIPHLELIADFGDDWEPAWERYKALHHAAKHREYYPLHTDREELNIGVLHPFLRRVT
jgi:hypothetical protein